MSFKYFVIFKETEMPEELHEIVFQLVDLTSNLLSGYNECILYNLNQLDISDSKKDSTKFEENEKSKIQLFGSLWNWCNI